MKKIIFSLILIFSFCINVNAKKCECQYEATYLGGFSNTSEQNITGTIKFDTETKKMEMINLYWFGDNSIVIDSQLDSSWTEDRLINAYSDKCPTKINMCKATNRGIGLVKDDMIALIINNDLMSKITEYPFKFVTSEKLSYYIEELNDCNEAELIEDKSTCDSIVVKLDCDVYDDLYELMKKEYCNSDDEGCTSQRINKYNAYKEQIKDYCHQILGYKDYNSSCAMACLNLNSDIVNLEKINITEGQCGFSQKLILFIANILKWVKYIVPVAVIILGIIDFLRALSTEKDDGLKKAQGRFIRRVIAAALIFIIPFILEFIIEKMGFISDTCGIF